MEVIIDEEASKVYVKIHGEPIQTEVTHTLEKHGALLHWDGHGKLMGVEFISSDPPGVGVIPVRYAVTNGAGHA